MESSNPCLEGTEQFIIFPLMLLAWKCRTYDGNVEHTMERPTNVWAGNGDFHVSFTCYMTGEVHRDAHSHGNVHPEYEYMGTPICWQCDKEIQPTMPPPLPPPQTPTPPSKSPPHIPCLSMQIAAWNENTTLSWYITYLCFTNPFLQILKDFLWILYHLDQGNKKV